MTIRSLIRTNVMLAFFIALLISGCSSSDGDGPSDPPAGTPTALTESGWGEFTAGNWAEAVADFEAAIAQDPTHGEAYVGLGWARMQLASSTEAMLAAVADFDGAIAAGQTSAELYAGRAAAHLGTGGSSFAGAASDAAAALAADSTFTFSHRPSFDVTDLRLIIAFTHVAQGDLEGALAAADEIEDSGIEPGQPATWVVGGTTFPSYEAAVLAQLQALSLSYAG